MLLAGQMLISLLLETFNDIREKYRKKVEMITSGR
jgi:hypothetical protein